MAEVRGTAVARVGVLGPLELHVAGREVVVGGPRRRALLAVLALAEGRTVSVDALVDAVWPDEDPDVARRALLSQISRLRSHLGPAADALERAGAGYRLRAGAVGLDVTEVRAGVAAARAADDPAAARQLLLQAAAAWRGEPLAEFADLPELVADAAALAELRAAVLDGAVEAGLAADLRGELVDEATAVARLQPLRESSTLLLMRVLAATGRTADALRAAHEHRRRVRDATGLDPSPALADLERELVAGEPQAVPTPSAPTPPATTARAPAAPASGSPDLQAAQHGTSTPVGRPPTPLLGREAELDSLTGLQRAERLVTVVGPGGVGKTRLAQELAAAAAEAGGAVAVVLLAPVTHDDEVVAALAAALGLRPSTPEGALAACQEHLAIGPTLLVVDNCEHVLAGCRELIGRVLPSCPSLHVLATSREPLALPVEQVFRLGPLRTGVDAPVDDAHVAPAVALFAARARRVRPGFTLDGPARDAVDHIVRRLDGLPLAIELAAGRLHSFSLGDLVTRLDRALDLFAGAGQEGEARHRTLRDTIAWSYALLADDHRELLRHLAVFPDGFDLDAAEGVSAALGHGGDPAAGLARLVDASLVAVELDRDVPRYRMLETIRAFAHDELVAAGEDARAAALLRAWAADLLAWLDARWRTPDEGEADARLRRELANLRAARRSALDDGELDVPIAAALTLDVPSQWRDLSELWAWTVELAEDPRLVDHPQRLVVLGAAARATWLRGDLDGAEAIGEAALAEAPTPLDAGSALHALAAISMFRGDLARSEERWQAAAARSDIAAPSHAGRALAVTYGGDTGRAIGIALDALAAAQVLGAPSEVSFTSYAAGEAHAATDPAAAERHYLAALEWGRRGGSSFNEALATLGLVTLWSRTGRRREALAGYRTLVDHWRRMGSWTQEWTTLRNLARELADDHPAEALALIAAADAAPEASAIVGPGADEHARLVARLEAAVGPGVDAVRARARTTPRAEVAESAVALLDRLLEAGSG